MAPWTELLKLLLCLLGPFDLVAVSWFGLLQEANKSHEIAPIKKNRIVNICAKLTSYEQLKFTAHIKTMVNPLESIPAVIVPGGVMDQNRSSRHKTLNPY